MSKNHIAYLTQQIDECKKDLENHAFGRASEDLARYRAELDRTLHGNAQGPAFIAFFCGALAAYLLLYFAYKDANVGDFGELVYLAGVAIVTAAGFGAGKLAEIHAYRGLVTKYSEWLTSQPSS